MYWYPKHHQRRRSAGALALLWLILGVQPDLHAAQDLPEPVRASVDGSDPFRASSFGIELGGGAYVEAWNLNGSSEWIVEGTAGGWWTPSDGIMVLGQFHGSHVDQDTVPNAFLKGFSLLTRFRVRNDHRNWDPFLEIGPGMVWSKTEVPATGTRFNFLILAGAGISRRLSARTHLTTGFRWFHLSNANRQGRGRNPDIQALGGFAAVTIGL